MRGSTGRMRTRRGLGAVTLACAVTLTAGVVPAGAQETPRPAPRPAPVPCDTCTASAREVERALEEAQEALQRAGETLAERQADLAAAPDSVRLQRAYVRALEAQRAAQLRYRVVASRLMRREMLRARREAERAMRAMQLERPGPSEGWLGVSLSGSFRIEDENGRPIMRWRQYPVVEAVDPDSPAERAGVEARDLLLALNGRDLTRGVEPLTLMLKPGLHLDIRVKRGRSVKTLQAIVARRPEVAWGWTMTPPPAAEAPAAPPAPPSPLVPAHEEPAPSAPIAALPPLPVVRVDSSGSAIRITLGTPDLEVMAGAQVQRVGDLRDYFAVRDGLLVLRVLPGTPADRAGLRAGDVIVRAGGRSITTPLSLGRAMARAERGTLELRIVRKKRTRTVLLRW